MTARQVAMLGRGTEFASTYAGYQNLPENERRRYEGLRVVHSLEASQRLIKPELSERKLAAWRSVPSKETNFVWQRRDGRSSLAIGATTDNIVSMDVGQSRALLDDLLVWTTRGRFCYGYNRHVDDIVIWDKPGMLDRALPYDPSSERKMRRTTIAGDEPWG